MEEGQLVYVRDFDYGSPVGYGHSAVSVKMLKHYKKIGHAPHRVTDRTLYALIAHDNGVISYTNKTHLNYRQHGQSDTALVCGGIVEMERARQQFKDAAAHCHVLHQEGCGGDYSAWRDGFNEAAEDPWEEMMVHYPSNSCPGKNNELCDSVSIWVVPIPANSK